MLAEFNSCGCRTEVHISYWLSARSLSQLLCQFPFSLQSNIFPIPGISTWASLESHSAYHTQYSQPEPFIMLLKKLPADVSLCKIATTGWLCWYWWFTTIHFACTLEHKQGKRVLLFEESMGKKIYLPFLFERKLGFQ